MYMYVHSSLMPLLNTHSVCSQCVCVMCCCEVSMHGRQFSCQYLDVLNNMMGFLVVKWLAFSACCRYLSLSLSLSLVGCPDFWGMVLLSHFQCIRQCHDWQNFWHNNITAGMQEYDVCLEGFLCKYVVLVAKAWHLLWRCDLKCT